MNDVFSSIGFDDFPSVDDSLALTLWSSGERI